MFTAIKRYSLVAVTAVTLGTQMLVPSLAFAATTPPADGAGCQGSVQTSLSAGADAAAGGGANCTSGTDATGTLKKTAKTVVDVFSVLVGIVAVIFVILGGFKYITSGGDSSKVGSAKSTLVYALVGLVIVALAQVIVRYTISTAADASAPIPPPGGVLLFSHFLR